MGYFHEERVIMLKSISNKLLYKSDEYEVSSNSTIELMNEKPFHNYTNKHLALSIFPTGEMIDMVADKNDFFRRCLDNGEGFMDAYLEFNMTEEPYASKLLFIASDLDGNSQEEEVAIAKSSRKDIVNLLDKQLNKIGFKGIDELFVDFEIRKCNFEIESHHRQKSKDNTHKHQSTKDGKDLLSGGRG